jgi:glycosyltransferase involved in cell wall biosynthesis
VRGSRGTQKQIIPTGPLTFLMKIALTILSENPLHKTGLTSLFHELVLRGLKLFPEVSWLIFAGPGQDWGLTDSRVEWVRRFPANDRLKRRLMADHLQVAPMARARGADVLVTVGFVPIRKCLPIAMHVLTLHALDNKNQMGLLRGLYRRWMMKLSWPKADLVLVNSRWTADQVLSLYPGFRDRLLVSYEGLQHEIFNTLAAPDEPQQLREKFGIAPGYFLWLSNFYPYKQAELLIAGYARLDAETRRKHPLVMVGGDWFNGLESAQAQAKALGVETDVKFPGWVDDRWVAPLYRHAAAFCLASREETFGRCVIEAMACGTPCAVNDIPIMREVTEGHAVIVDFRNVDAVSEALRNFSTDTSLVTRLRDEGLIRARQFTFEKLATERITAIQRLVASRNQLKS